MSHAVPSCSKGSYGLMIGMVALGVALLGVVSADAKTFSVTETADLPDVNLCNGVCDADPFATVRCTLRAAIEEANCTLAPDTIVFRSTLGTINLSLGELEIFTSMTIKGTSSKKQRVNGFNNAPDGIFEVDSGDVNFEYLILEEGINSEDGGCLDIDDDNDVVRVRYSQFLNCESFGDGGAISSDADLLDVLSTTFRGNAAADDGGAINTEDDSAVRSVTKVKSSTFKFNFADGSGGAMFLEEDDDVEQQVVSSTFEGNTADGVGGGVAHFGTSGGDTSTSGITIVQTSKFKNNSANFGGALCDGSDEGLFFPQGNTDQGGNVGHLDFSGQQDFFCSAGVCGGGGCTP